MACAPLSAHPAMADDYVMIDSIQVKNFRCFKDLNVGGLKRFNVVVGDSGSGKTALLESIFITAASNPEAYIRMRVWRGLGEGIRLIASKASYESLFRELFFDFKKTDGANLRFTDSNQGQRSLTIRYHNDEQFSLSLKGTASASAMTMDPILFRWKIRDKVYDGGVQLRDGNLIFAGFSEVYPIWLISPVSPDPVAELFSELSKRRQHLPIIEAIQAVFPSVTDLSLESISGQLVICASLDYLEEKMPVGFVSGGINKYLWMLVAIASNPGGVVLIDEIENGLYFKALPLVLESIAKAAEVNRVQLFATTHSAELLMALAGVMESRKEHFTLLRAQRAGKECQMRIAKGPSSIAAIHQHLELRG